VRDSVPLFVLQPNRGAAAVRHYLIRNGYRLTDEELVCDGGEIYEIICAAPGEEPMPTDVLLEVGPRIVEQGDPLLPKFIERRINHYRRILLQVAQGDSQRAVAALEKI